MISQKIPTASHTIILRGSAKCQELSIAVLKVENLRSNIREREVDFVIHPLHTWKDHLAQAIPSIWTFAHDLVRRRVNNCFIGIVSREDFSQGMLD